MKLGDFPVLRLAFVPWQIVSYSPVQHFKTLWEIVPYWTEKETINIRVSLILGCVTRAIPECLGPSGTNNIPEGLKMQLMKERQLLREPLCGISFIVVITFSKRADLFSVLHMMHEAGG